MQSQRIDWLYYLPEVVLYLDYKIPSATTSDSIPNYSLISGSSNLLDFSVIHTQSKMHIYAFRFSGIESVAFSATATFQLLNYARELGRKWSWKGAVLNMTQFIHCFSPFLPSLSRMQSFQIRFLSMKYQRCLPKVPPKLRKNMRDETFGKKLLTLDIYIWSSS